MGWLHYIYFMVLSAGVSTTKILKLLKKAMWIICSSGYLSHSEPLFKKLNMLKSDGMFKLQLLTFVLTCYITIYLHIS